MKKAILYFILYLVTVIDANNAFAQTTFSKVFYDSLQGGVTANSSVLLNDNGFILVGFSRYQNGFIMRADSLGGTVWAKQFEVINNSGNTQFNDIVATNDSCFVVVGSAVDSGSQLACLIKINQSGDILWSKTFGYDGYGFSVSSVQQTYDSGYILAGNVTYPTTKLFLVKLDSIGNYEWGATLIGGNNNNVCGSIKQTPDSGYVLTGHIENYPPYNSNAFITKLSPSGSVVWAKQYTSTNDFLGGKDLYVEPTGFFCYMINGFQRTILKLDFNGNMLWGKSYGDFSGGYFLGDSQMGFKKMNDGSFVFASSAVNCAGDGTIIKVDSIGNIIWSKASFMYAIAAKESTDKGIVVVGNGPLCGVKKSAVLTPQIGIIKTDSVGNGQNCISEISPTTSASNLTESLLTFTIEQGLQEDTATFQSSSISLVSYFGCVDFAGSVFEPVNNQPINIFPNPSSGIFKFDSGKAKLKQINIYNHAGSLVYKSEKNTTQNEINLKNKTTGIYFYRITFTDNSYSTGKLILE